MTSLNTPISTPLLTVTWFFTNKYRARQDEAGTEHVARQLKKQGVPLHVAVALLATRLE